MGRKKKSKAFNDLVDRLLQDTHLLDFKQSYELFGKWDVKYGFDKRPKSDVMMRALAREYRRRIPMLQSLMKTDATSANRPANAMILFTFKMSS